MAGEMTSAAVMTGNPYLMAAGVAMDTVSGILGQKDAEKEAQLARREAAERQASSNRTADLQIRQAQGEEQAASQKAQIKAMMAKGRARVQSKGVGGLGIARRENQSTNMISLELQDQRRRVGGQIAMAQNQKANASAQASMAHSRINKSVKDAQFTGASLLVGAATGYMNKSFLEGNATDELKDPAGEPNE